MLKDTEFAFAVAKVRANENKLLSSASVEALINASDYKDALKILSEAGYGDFDKNDEEVILSNRQRYAFELVYSSAPDKSCLDFLIVRNDFHNFKAVLKAKITETDWRDLILTPSCISADKIALAVDNKDYSLAGDYAKTLETAYTIVTQTMDGQALEIFLDRKCIEESVRLAEKSKDEFSVSLANLMCFLADIKIAYRCIMTGKDRDFIKSALAECSLLDRDKLCSCCLSGIDELCEYVKLLGYAALSESIKRGYAAFEKQSDDILVERIRSAKYQSLGIAPLVAYYFAVDAEVKTVRIILSCKKNGVEVENIRERVRVLYV